jgi:predicted nucleic acid-binding protein
VVLLSETEGSFDRLAGLVRVGRIAGPRVHDARVAALCLEGGVSELWSADRDLGRFPALVTLNPLLD